MKAEKTAPTDSRYRAIIALTLLASAALLVIAFLPSGLGLDLSGSDLLPSASAVVLATLGIRLGLWLTYRPVAPPPAGSPLPSLTIVIPAFNEGPGVRTTIDSILAADYPASELTVIAVNDGSRDDTGRHLDDAARAYPGRVTVIHLPENRGKRHALHAGFSRATSDLIATVDSDSRVFTDTLRHLVAPFIADANTGGVAGQVRVWNRRRNLLTRMLHVRYLLGFDLIRAYQSQLKTVWCCPGALQCYRRSLVAPHLEAWRDQTFLGAACKNGDDHAMTNLVLSLGADTRYQQSARVETLVPETYGRLTRMFTRWGRSATREGLRALRFTPRRAAALGPFRGTLMALDALAQPASILLRVGAVLGGAWLLFFDPMWLLRGLVAGTLFGILYGLVYLRSERSWDFAYGILYGWFAMFALFWVQPWATLTVRRNTWLTRRNPR
jgi:hyaluronan synthase